MSFFDFTLYLLFFGFQSFYFGNILMTYICITSIAQILRILPL